MDQLALSLGQMEEGCSSQESTEREDSKTLTQKKNVLSATDTSLRSKLLAESMRKEKEEDAPPSPGLKRVPQIPGEVSEYKYIK